MRLLLVTFYFPPAGGAGVQRPLRLAEELAALGVEVHVLAPTDPRWIHRDPGRTVSPLLQVHRAPYPGPRGRLPGHELYGLTGARRTARWLALAPRRLLVPDENAGWLATAAPAALAVCRREQVDCVLTTSPPGSAHLLGLLLKRALGLRWIADLRDSLVAKEDRAYERLLVRAKEKPQLLVARAVARRADAAACVTETIAAETRGLDPRGPVVVIPNGCDFEESDGLRYERGERFRITHTGSFFGRRDPRPFLNALAQSDPAVVARFVGDFRPGDREWAASLGLGERLQLLPFAPRAETLALQRDSEALLLLLPEIGARGRDVPSAKLYEYLAARRPILAAVPPDGSAAELVRAAGAGVIVEPEDADGIAAALADLVGRWRRGTLDDVAMPTELHDRLSRREQARQLADLIEART